MQLSSIKLTIVGSARRDIEDLLRPMGIAPTSVAELTSFTYQSAAPPDVVVLDLRHTGAVPAAVAELTRRHPQTGVVVVAARLDPAMMLDALNAGARGFVAEPLSAKDLQDAVTRVVAPPVVAQVGRILAFVGAKGGVGTTTLAVNVATALARLAKGNTLLIDLNARYGDAAACLGAEPRFTVSDALENAHRLDVPFMRGLVVKTAADLDLLAAPERVTPGPPDLAKLRALFDFAKRQYHYTVLDLPRTDGAILEALDEVGTIFLVVSQELTAVRSAARMLGPLRQRYKPERVQIAIGRQDRHAEISPEDLEQSLGGSVRVFPSEYRRALESLNRGRPLVLENHSRLSAEMTRFVRELAGVTTGKPASKRTSKWPSWLRGGQA